MDPTLLGAYGPWAALLADRPASLSFRRKEWTDVEAWRLVARQRLLERLAPPHTGGTPEVTVHRQTVYDGLHAEDLSWQLPYGPPTEAIYLKAAGSAGRLPGILALHDHAGKKYFGKRKIACTAGDWHPAMLQHHSEYYGGVPWANELAKRGYAVLVPDAFSFASRRVRMTDVPEVIRAGRADPISETEAEIEPRPRPRPGAYNLWAADHESIMAKSLFCAGTTWPGVLFGEDQRALDVLCARGDVDAERVGCGGLSGGGLRTVYLGGIDPLVRCAVCAGTMTTWRDLLLHKSHTHTWMIYIPLLPLELDFPESLGLRVPLPTMVLNNLDDALFTLSEMERASRILYEIFAKAGAERQLQCRFFPGPHKFDGEMQAAAFDWFDRWLRG
jgi:dienelactone hydrolase